MKKKLFKSLIIMGIILITDTLSAENTVDIVASYGCRYSSINITVVKDTDRNGIYDTYSINWCNGTIETYPICAIGDISRWPPMGIPTRDIYFSNFDNRTFTEQYYRTNSYNLICWFTKFAGVDTVYYYDNFFEAEAATDVDDYNPELNLKINLQPNPATNYINIDYGLKLNGWVVITLYNDIGNIVATIEEKYCSQGHYSLTYPLEGFSAGTYFIAAKFGQNEVISRRIVIIK